MLRIIFMTFSLIATIGVYIAAYFISFNGKTASEIMYRLPILFTPAGYIFSIWVVIYILLFVWLYGFWRNQWKVSKFILNLRAILFIFSSLLTIFWFYLWHYEFFHLTVVVMIALLATLTWLYFTYPKNENLLFERVPISIYLGWVVISLMTITNYDLTFHEWSGWGLSSELWTVFFLTMATAIALHFMYHYRDIAFNLVIIWVFIGIAAKNGLDALFVTTASLFLTAVIIVGFFYLRKTSPTTK